MKALPPGWRPWFVLQTKFVKIIYKQVLFFSYDEKSKSYYYHNNITGKTQWEHPLDNIYRGLVKKVRTESQSLSIGEPTEDATYVRDDLPSFEEPPSSIFTKPTEQPLPVKRDIKLSPIKAKPSMDIFGKKTLFKQKSEEPVMSAFSKHMSRFNSFDESDDLNLKPQKELTLSGGGAMFLKSNTKKIDSDLVKTMFLKTNKEIDTQPRSILRERNLETSKSMEFDKSTTEKSDIDDDKKIVRFNLDSNTDVGLTASDKSSSEDDFQTNENIDIHISQTKSRFTVSPVKENMLNTESISKNNEESTNKNLKLIRPNPDDFVNPKLNISRKSDSDEDSVINDLEKKQLEVLNDKKSNKRFLQETSKAKTEEVEKAKQAIWKAKNEELENFKEDMQESHKKELERLLIEEKTKYEMKIKVELENLRLEMENRATGTLKEEKTSLENNLENEISKLNEQFECKKEKIRETLNNEFESEKNKLEKSYKEKLAAVEKELAENLETARANIILSHNNLLEKLKENHAITIEELKKEFLTEVFYLFSTYYYKI